MMVTLEQIEREAMALSPADQAQLADRLWESVMGNRTFDVVITPELERLLDEGPEGAKAAKRTRCVWKGLPNSCGRGGATLPRQRWRLDTAV